MNLLDIERYTEYELEAFCRQPNRVIAAFQPIHFQQAGYPSRVTQEGELWRYGDVMQEGRFASNLRILGGLSEEEFSSIKDWSQRIFEFSGLSGRNVLTRSLISRRAVNHLCGRGGSILEIGPGCGYLAALLINDGYQYLGVEVTQAFYLYQNRFWHKAYGTLLSELVGAEDRIEFVNGNSMLHIPWWKWVDTTYALPKIDLVVCNHTLCEMDRAARLFTFGRISALFKKQGYGFVVVEGFGSSLTSTQAQAIDDLALVGLELIHTGNVHDDGVNIFSPQGCFKKTKKLSIRHLVPRNYSQSKKLIGRFLLGKLNWTQYQQISAGFKYIPSISVTQTEVVRYFESRYSAEQLDPLDVNFMRAVLTS